MAETYRNHILYPANNSDPLFRGGRKVCPACGGGDYTRFDLDMGLRWTENYLTEPKVCSFWKVIFGCREKRNHLHQDCKRCKHKWTVGFKE